MYCIHCGAKNPDAARFCLECGQALQSVRTAPSTAATQAPAPLPTPAPLAAPTYASPAPRRERRGLSGWAKAGIALLIFAVVAVGGVSAARQWAHVGTNATPGLMPAETVALISVAPNPLQLTQLSQLRALAGAFGALLSDSAGSLNELLLSNLDIDLKSDVLSWVGLEFAVGVVREDEYTSSVLVTAAYRNAKKALAFMDKIRAAQEDEGWTFEEDEYDGVAIVYGTDGWGSEMAYAQVKGFMVLATTRSLLERAIDTAEGSEPGLDEDEVYQRVVKELPSRRAGYVYLDYRAFADEISSELPGAMQDWVQAVDGMGVSVGLAKGGAMLDWVLTSESDLSGPFVGQSPNANDALKLAPADSLAYLGGLDLSGNLDAFASLAGASGEYGAEQAIDEIAGQLGLTKDELIGWAGGEYAIAVFEDTDGWMGDTSTPLGGALIIEADDKEAAQHALESLVSEAGIDAQTKKIGGQTFTVLSEGSVTLGYGWSGDYLLIGASQQSLEALAAAQKTSLAEDEDLRAAMRALPAKNTGYVHVNVAMLLDLVYREMDSYSRENFDANVRPYLEPFRTLTFAGEPLAGEIGRGALFIRLEE